MEERILVSVKKVVGLAEAYTAFDEDILMHINSTFSTLTQMGVGPENGYMIEDKSSEWSEFISEDIELLNMVRTYMALKVKMLFDPPPTSYVISAYEKSIQEYEYRMNLVVTQKAVEAAEAAEALEDAEV